MDDDHGRSAASPALDWAGVWRTAKVMLGAGSVLAIMAAFPYAFLWTLFWLSSIAGTRGNQGLRHWLWSKVHGSINWGSCRRPARPGQRQVPGGHVSSGMARAPHISRLSACDSCGIFRALRGNGTEGEKREGRLPQRGRFTAATRVRDRPYIDAEFHAERKVLAQSRVAVRVWGSE